MKCPKCKSKYKRNRLCSNKECVLSTKPWVYSEPWKQRLRQAFWKTWYYTPRNLRCFIQNRFWYRHDLVKTGLPKGSWCDKDHVLFLAVMKLFTDYIELEQPFVNLVTEYDELTEHVDNEFGISLEECDKRQVEMYQKMLKIYIDYKVEYPKMLQTSNERLSDDTNGDWCDAENNVYDFETKLLERVIEIRIGLWV